LRLPFGILFLMEEVYKNQELLKLVRGTYYIHDSAVSRFDIYQQNDELLIDVYFNSWDRKLKINRLLKIHFSGIIKYQFLYSSDYSFYDVERYKFFEAETGFYISLDPYDELEVISENDEDVILCKTIEGQFI